MRQIKVVNMNKETIASLLGAVITLATLAGPALAGLNELPAPFCENGECNFLVVVGEDAKPADVVGAINIAARLAAEKYTLVSREATTTVTGAEEEDIPIGSKITATGLIDTSLDDDDVAGLFDGTVDFQDESYDAHEEIVFSTSSPAIATSRASDDDYETSVVMEVTGKGHIGYYYIFDESINVSTATEDDPLDITILGIPVKIISATEGSITVRAGETATLQPGDSTTVEGETITLAAVSDTSVLVRCGSESETIDSSETGEICGLEVYVDTIFNDEGTENDYAVLIIAEDVEKTYDDGDAFIGEDEDDPDWVWDLGELTSSASGDSTDGSGGPTIGVVNEFIKDDPSDDPVEVGECYTLPNNYAKVCLDELTVKDDDYATYTISYETGVDLSDAGHGGTSSDKVVQIVSDVDEGIYLLNSSKKVDKVYIEADDAASNGAVDIYYTDPSDNKEYWDSRITLDNGQTVVFAQVNYHDTKGGDINISISANFTANNYATITFDDTRTGGDDIAMVFYTDGTDWQSLGSTVNTEEASELTLGGTNIGTKDEDHRTNYGIIVKDPESHGASDEVVLEIPGDQVKATVRVYGPETTTTTEEGGEIKEVSPITMPIANLDTEIDDLSTVGKHVILVGGPAVNRWTAAVMGYDYKTYGPDIEEISEGEGFIGLYTGVEGVLAEDQTALVVFGWTKDETRVACAAVQQFATVLADIDADKVIVTGSVESPTVTVPEETTTTTTTETTE